MPSLNEEARNAAYNYGHLTPSQLLSIMPYGADVNCHDSHIIDAYPPSHIVKDCGGIPKDKSVNIGWKKVSGLYVKWGRRMTLGEVQSQWFAYGAFHRHGVKVPRTLGWRTYEGVLFQYTERCPGVSVTAVEDDMTDEQKESVCNTVNSWIRIWMAIPTEKEQGSGYLARVYPFHGVQSRNLKKISDAVKTGKQAKVKGPYYWSHGDLINTENIMVAQDPWGRYYVTGIVDWELAGWWFWKQDGQWTQYGESYI